MNKIIVNILKHSTLAVLFFVLISLTRFYASDYCTSVYYVFIVPLIIFLIIINVIILYWINFRRKKYKTTNYVLVFLVFIFSIHILINNLSGEKELEHIFKVEGNERLSVLLYRNNTYQLVENSPHVTCHYFGKYNLENNYLTFDEEIVENTTHQISRQYKFNFNKKQFESLEMDIPNLVENNF